MEPDQSEHGKKGGRPSKQAQAKAKASKEVRLGKQSTMGSFFRPAFGPQQQQQPIQRPQAATPNPSEKTILDYDELHSADDQSDDEELEQLTQEQKDALQEALESRQGQRTSYSESHKAKAVKVYKSVGGNQRKAVRLLNRMGYSKLETKSLRKWIKKDSGEIVAGKRGKKVNEEFEGEVMQRLVFVLIDGVDDQKKATVLANVAYSYEVIKLAAKDVQGQQKWSEDAAIQKLKFSAKWVHSFLERAQMRRKRVTAKEKKRPSDKDVRERMRAIQQVIVDHKFEPADVFSADETGINFGIMPRYQYVLQSQGRGTVPDSDEKARFTAMLWGAADGSMGPPYIIIKCSVVGADLRGTRVLNAVLEDLNKEEPGAWEKLEWSRELKLNIKGKEVTQTYYRPYLLHVLSNTVITLQHKAWMDSVGMAMWADTQMKRYLAGREVLVVWDNCGPHNVEAVREVFAEQGIKVESLPPNMTDLLQVMDLVVNGPLKAAMLAARSLSLYESYQQYRIACLRELAKGPAAKLPLFQPPKPTQLQGLQCILEACRGPLSTDKFQTGVRRAFISVGLTPEGGVFREYTGRSAPVVSAALSPMGSVSSSERFSAVDLISDIEFEVRGDEQDNEETDAASV